MSCDHGQVTLLLLLDLIRRLNLVPLLQRKQVVDRKLLDKQFTSAFHSSIVKVSSPVKRRSTMTLGLLNDQTKYFVRSFTVAVVSHSSGTLSSVFSTSFA